MKLKELQKEAKQKNKDVQIQATAYGHKVTFTE